MFEHDYNSWQERRAAVAALPPKRDAYSLMIHSMPQVYTKGGEGSPLKEFVNSIAEVAEYLYITTNDVDFYESFAEDWADFVDSVPE